jgi:hypothetical protein
VAAVVRAGSRPLSPPRSPDGAPALRLLRFAELMGPAQCTLMPRSARTSSRDAVLADWAGRTSRTSGFKGLRCAGRQLSDEGRVRDSLRLIWPRHREGEPCQLAASTVIVITQWFLPFGRSKAKPASSYMCRVPLYKNDGLTFLPGVSCG